MTSHTVEAGMTEILPTVSLTPPTPPDELAPFSTLDCHVRQYTKTLSEGIQTWTIGDEASSEEGLTPENALLNDRFAKGTGSLSGHCQPMSQPPEALEEKARPIPAEDTVAVTRSNASSRLNTIPPGGRADSMAFVLQHPRYRTTRTAQPPREQGLYEINVGCDGEITRWELDAGKPLTFFISLGHSLSIQDKNHTEASIVEATEEMNTKGGGSWPLFKRVYRESSAIFKWSYEDLPDNQNPRTLARAFTPSCSSRTVYVYRKALTSKYRPYLANIFLHELGHILGLRHEFAPETEQANPCSTLGDRNDDSVMNYFSDPKRYKLQETDIKYLKDFYDMTEFPGDPPRRIKVVKPKRLLLQWKFQVPSTYSDRRRTD